MMAPLLSIENLTVQSDGAVAVDGLSLSVAAGEVVAVLGANGAGKSSLLRSIIGLENPSAGRILFGGRDLSRYATHRRARLGIGYCPEGRRLFNAMTIADTLDAAGPSDPEERIRRKAAVHDLFPQLVERSEALAWQLSGGQQQMLAIARALMGAPRLLLLDEPSLGLAPAVLGELMEVVGKLASQGVGVLLAEQAAARALAVADRVAVMRRGRVVLDAAADTLERDAVAREMLG
ncbi:MAG: ATP-binding cassette domain-containing protein [Rhodospirillaceae bacterium]|nr:ATP-binding cassette domain-containing protein [Rhodospirillaceae bacterium]